METTKNTRRRGAGTAGGRFRFMALMLPAFLAGCGSDSGGLGTGSGTAASVIPGISGTPGASAFDPTVNSSSPVHEATNVATSSNSKDNVVTGTPVTATFSQPMDPATIDSDPAGTLPTFTLKETVGDVDVPGTVAMDITNTVATFQPTAAALTPNTEYTATMTMAATNAVGLAMANPVAWTFTTKSVAFTSQAPVALGTVGTYAIFADTAITNATDPATITGDMGVGPAVTSAAITGPWALVMDIGGTFSTSTQVTGEVYAFDYAAPTPADVTTASADMGTAYGDAAGRLLPDFQDLAGGDLNGLTLTPGLYTWSGAVTLTSDVIFSGGPDDVWILQIAGTATLGSASSTLLSGGARARNIFWQVAGATMTLGTNAHLDGVVLAQFAIDLSSQATALSRLLAQTAVNLDENTVTQPGSTVPPAIEPVVNSSSPSDGALDIATSYNSSSNVVTGTPVSATFSHAMDPATLESDPAGTLLTFTLMETLGSVDVPGTVAMDITNTVATFQPTAAALTPNTEYTATITTAARNSGNTAMGSPAVWTFTTTLLASTRQAPVELGLAGDYAIFALTGIDNATAPAAITGNMGVGPGVTSTAITGWALDLPPGGAFSTSAQVTGNVYAFDYAPPTPTNVTTASNDMGTAYTDAAGRLLPDFQDLATGNLAGLTLAPGLYKWGTAVNLPVGTDVTLSGGPDDVWIFQIAGTLTTGANTNIFLIGGAQAKNIVWQVAGASVDLGANAHFEGVILAQVAINFGNQASANSRLLAQAAVNLDQNVVTEPAP